MPHPTVLHDETKSTLKVNEGSASKEVARVAQLEEATSSCTNTCNATRAIDAITNSMIVPVRVHHRTNPERQVVVYALLDPASNGTFIKESILENLQVDGTETQLQLNTMHGGIASKLYPYQVDVEVGLLIGSNCPSAIKPEELIPWRSSDPYAIRTLLGWGIIGPISGSSNKENSEVLCHRVAVKEIGSKEPSPDSLLNLTQRRLSRLKLSRECSSWTSTKLRMQLDSPSRWTTEGLWQRSQKEFITTQIVTMSYHCHFEMNPWPSPTTRSWNFTASNTSS
ncbi:unnamed protein product [Porites evermanni]|uniref:Uncharacterized protein n=1 Tax=Porites evermanni TaxID=104178 RepID=A0ABN8PG67_9CNID|nr:unnamed protein product [Porites evermanni]